MNCIKKKKTAKYEKCIILNNEIYYILMCIYNENSYFILVSYNNYVISAFMEWLNGGTII